MQEMRIDWSFFLQTKFERIQVQMEVITQIVWFLMQFVCLNVSLKMILKIMSSWKENMKIPHNEHQLTSKK